MPVGPDISAFQGQRDPEWFTDQEFVIIRAFDRHGNVDTQFAYNWSTSRGRCPRGAYGWPRPGFDNQALGAALAAAAPDAELGLWCDYEHSPEYGLASVDDLAAYLAGIGDRPKGVYSNIPTYPGGPADTLPWWMANYGPNNGQRGEPSLTPPRAWQIHQYTSRGGPGGSGLDLNYAPTLDLWSRAMPNPLCLDVPYDPGNAGIARPIQVQTVTLHRTTGRWPGDYSVGKNRDHNSGTFQFLIGQDDGQWVQFYPVNTFCSHAAGSNEVGPGIEISGQNGEPLTEWQVHALGIICRWLRDEWGITPTFAEGDPRVWADREPPLGFITHNHVDYPPDRSYLHNDYITPDEFARALAGPTPDPEDDEDVKLLPFLIQAKGGQWVYDPRTHSARAFGTEQARDLWVAIFTYDFGHAPAIRDDAQAVALLEDAIR